MARLLRLPTTSPRQARAIVRLQLDRLSPLPAADTVFDLSFVRKDGSEGVFALGVIRRQTLNDPVFRHQRIVKVPKKIDDTEVVFRFRNPSGVDDRETRLLKHAPLAAAMALGFAAVTLAGNLRAESWRTQRLPEIAEAQRQATRKALHAEQQTQARAEWTALDRSDASTLLLCVLARLDQQTTTAIAVRALALDPEQITVQLPTGGDRHALEAAGAEVGQADDESATATFVKAVCA
tara:strand:- start:20226 stop:20936 length:711 start_codon:yes stop_codon:yes gene_type:complete